ncbi:MAG: cytochrome c3 family protein [Mariniblastus sp.]|nr:cytochrome c3 family protein [Mariniblastus sp.]
MSQTAITFYIWLCLSGVALWFAAYSMLDDNAVSKSLLLPGKTSHGHYQIEMKCSACHTTSMGIKKDACLDCHEAELKLSNDTHAAKKFNDPTNVERLATLDVRECTACHREHVPDQTRKMGLTIPTDYCFHCHQDVQEQRPSHREFAFDSCSTAGCHNYHDNRALYEKFLLQHTQEPDLLDDPQLPLRLLLDRKATSDDPTSRRKDQLVGAPDGEDGEIKIPHDWHGSAHDFAGTTCAACHGEGQSWSDNVSMDSCANCHDRQFESFIRGRHGMRIQAGLSPMVPGAARLPMKQSAAHDQLTCMSCHTAHQYDTRRAAVDACLQCHNDEHSLAYKRSAHYRGWQDEIRGEAAPGTGVSCATCHLPRMVDEKGNTFVEHNQNDNLRPNEKMLREVCMHCHGLGFSIDSLADESLIDRCFQGTPKKHVDSIGMAQRWFEAKQKKKKRP